VRGIRHDSNGVSPPATKNLNTYEDYRDYNNDDEFPKRLFILFNLLASLQFVHGESGFLIGDLLLKFKQVLFLVRHLYAVLSWPGLNGVCLVGQ